MSSASYKFLTEENKLTLNKLQDQNIVYYSELNSWYTRNAFRSFSLKYVVEGSIQYTTNHPVSYTHLDVYKRQDDIWPY